MSRRSTGAARAALALCCVSVMACGKPAAELKTERPRPPELAEGEVRIPDGSRQFVEVEEVSASADGSTVMAPAHVEFRDGAVSEVGAPLDGRVTTVHVRVGQRVSVGDPLVTLDSPDAAAMRAAASTAQAAAREAHLELDRQRRMQQEGVGTERELVTAETKASSADAEVARVESGARSIGPGAGAAVVVRAPIAGVVITRRASLGLAVQRGGDPLLSLGDATALWLVADIFERDLAHVRAGATARVTLPSLDQPLPARVASLGTIVAPGLRTAPVFLTLDTHGLALRPGMYGRVAIDAGDAVVSLPASAVLIKNGKETVVYVQKDASTYVRRPVVLAQSLDGRVQIVSGVAPGEMVVVKGALLLDGAADQLL